MSSGRRDLVAGAPAAPLLRVLVLGLPELDEVRAKRLIEDGCVFLAGKRCRDPGAQVAPGTRLVAHLPASRSSEAATPLVVLFEDEDVVVLDKRPGQHVNETETSAEVSLVERLADRDAFTVHRIDRETSGVVLLAKGREVAELLSREFRERRVEKRYLALVRGHVPDGAIDAPIGRDRRRPRARAVTPDGKPAETRVRTLGSLEDVSAIEARPITGRTHQIRVHLASRGAPILGDALYGGVMAVRLGGTVLHARRVLLHALELVIRVRGVEHRFCAPIPDDMAAFQAAGLPLATPSE